MKKVSIGVLTLLGVLATQQVTAQKTDATAATISKNSKQYQEVGINLSMMDKSVRPQDDFFNYVNGNWVKTAKIPADKASWGSFNELREKTDEASLDILNHILSDKFSQGSEGQKIQDLYASYMDLKKRDADGLKPILADFKKIDAIKNLKDLQSYLNQATKYGDNPFYGWRVGADLKDSKNNAIYLGAADLGLGKDYYQKENEANTKTLTEYQKHVAALLDIIGYKNSPEVAKSIVDFEKSLAKTYLTLEQGRDANKRYNPKTTAELSAMVKNIDLPNFLKSAGVNTDRVILGELAYYQNLDNFINEKNLPLIKDYMKVRLLSGNAGVLNQKMDALNFSFYSKYLQGQEEQRALNKRGLQMINGVLGEAFGKLYVEKYFPEEAKMQMQELIGYLIKSYQKHISELEWMSATTKEKALEKLSKFTVKVAYPDKWEDYSKLKIEGPNKTSLYENLKNVSAWRYSKNLEKVGQPVDKTKWGMTPQTVNAYYNPSNNEIVFPAGILQPPFFNFKADPAVNFGGIGAVIGHEIGHGFDDSGSKFDGEGNLNNWWTDEDRKNFEAATKKLGEQYSNYEPVKGSKVNGTFTMGENIGDLGGVAVAYDALQMYLKDHGNPGLISGYTQDQRFFLSWATVWRTKSTDKFLTNQVKTDPHSPGMYRAVGPLVNVDAFFKAFDIKEGDKHYKKPEERIKIW
ncbi:M13 family metallopeptidase [Chryseobacterium sp. POL2]|uniref:M13 family metallopeptidase n=1 Tax=Chryseobacterium sp. POL2 TaxID=2713414 RepID=UPI0013E13C6D|nr:M13 family metallopeptidase [Chryseobacterium sp. POL2]QIG89261.1 M13 family metallopeptidase [Chryseobacterium sp. POL2]